jgi:hypothetical protein
MRKGGRKLLVASLGVAAVSYVACGEGTVANLLAPPLDGGVDAQSDVAGDAPPDIRMDAIIANLLPPPDAFSPFDLVANLVAPVQTDD